jgi:cellulose biosynthesis protein BcsQ
MSTTFAIGNQKGGVAKTTTWTLAYALAELGHRVLMVDLDPQASLSIACNVDGEGEEHGGSDGRRGSRNPPASGRHRAVGRVCIPGSL